MAGLFRRKSAGRIFINYRRDDSRADSGRLYDRLVARFPGKVFRDVASLEPGVEWHDAIARVIGQSDACIVVIGKDWLNITDAAGRRRLDDPRDTVRQEIVAALQLQMRVFPVLVGSAKMPAEGDLAPELQSICRRNALEITEQDWDEDFRKLVRALEIALGLPPEKEGARSLSLFRNRLAWAAAGGMAALLLLAVAVYNAINKPPPVILDSRGGTKSSSMGPASGLDDSGTSGEEASRVSKSQSSGSASSPSNGAGKQQYTSSASQEAPPSEPPPRPIFNPSQLAGNWRALVTGAYAGPPHEEVLEAYRDNSFRVIFQGDTAAVGRWQYNPASDSMEIPEATNFLNGNVMKFACNWKSSSEGHDQFNGGCFDRMQNSWNVSLSRAAGSPPEVSYEDPRIDLSRLTMAERAAFTKVLAISPCTCPCRLTLLVCLEKDRSCPYSPTLANNLLVRFLQMTRQ